MNRKSKIIVSVVGISIVLLALLGLTYAFYLTRIQGNTNETSISVTTADLKLVYGDGNSTVNLSGLLPGKDIPAKIFTITNTGETIINNYKIYLENVHNQLELKEDLSYTLTCKSYKTTNPNVDFSTLTEDGTCSGASKTTFPSVMSVIATNSIDKGYTHRYELKVDYAETGVDQSIDMGKSIIAKVNVYDSKIKFLAREIIDNALSTATVSYNKSNYINPSEQDGTNYTIPAHATSLENERILTYTMDDYGTSYYFRGNVTNNYVNFAGLCWRIVRIEGDGSIKLILEDYDQECNSKDASGNLNMDGNWSDGNKYKFGVNNDRVELLNYSGGLADAFKTFQTTKLTPIDLENLKIDEWCYDNVITETNNSIEYYGAYKRININKKPSLKCEGTKLTKFSDNTSMYVGTLTADETVYAGLTGESSNLKYYLVNNFVIDNYLHWWLLSPYFFYEFDGGDFVFASIINYGLLSGGANSTEYYFRPAVTLKSGIEITEGVGTLEKPYIVAN